MQRFDKENSIKILCESRKNSNLSYCSDAILGKSFRAFSSENSLCYAQSLLRHTKSQPTRAPQVVVITAIHIQLHEYVTRIIILQSADGTSSLHFDFASVAIIAQGHRLKDANCNRFTCIYVSKISDKDFA